MAECSVCGRQTDMPYSCNYCGQSCCKFHRLPENHNCVGLSSSQALGPDFGSEESDTGSRSRSQKKRKQCSDCSNYIPTDRERCRSCRIKDDVSSPSPSTTVDGSLESDNSDEGSNEASETGSGFSGWLILPFLPVIWTGRFVSRTLRAIGGLISTYSIPILVCVIIFGGFVGSAYLSEETDYLDGAKNELGQDGLNSTEVEMEFHDRINDVRQEHDLPPLEYSDELQDVAYYHSKDMENRGYFAHESPDGEGVSDRYRDFGLSCAGGENIYKSVVFDRVETADGGTTRITTEEGLADALIEGWMNSPGHRENILEPRWSYHGLGVYFGDDEEALVTNNFC